MGDDSNVRMTNINVNSGVVSDVRMKTNGRKAQGDKFQLNSKNI